MEAECIRWLADNTIGDITEIVLFILLAFLSMNFAICTASE